MEFLESYELRLLEGGSTRGDFLACSIAPEALQLRKQVNAPFVKMMA